METETKEQIKQTVDNFFVAAGLNGRIAALEEVDGGILIKIESQEAGYLIGRDGETLRAIQQLLRGIVSRKTAEAVRLTLDVNDYQSEKVKALVLAAQNLAQEVARSGAGRSLPPMNAYERRAVHTALAEIAGVKTESEGEGENRRIAIKPINN